MKRAVPQDANSVPFSPLTDSDGIEEHLKQTLPEANRRVRTSAAMLGLAISVGAYGVVAPHQGDAAVAAEPTTSDPVENDAASVSVPTVAESATLNPSASSPTHTVQDGQTLWKIAELYGIDAAKLASVNGLQPNAVLHVGQVLQVPVTTQTVASINGTAVKSLPDLKAVPVVPAQPVAAKSSPESTAAQDLAKEQPSSLQGLKQNRDRLKQSLAELKSEESSQKSQVIASLPESVQRPALISYQVSPGDTLSSIAQAHGISPAELAKLNRLDNPNLVKVNQFIKVPQIAAQPTASESAPIAKAPTAQVPVVPSLASAQNPSKLNEPVALGGDAEQFAFVNPNRAGSRSNASQSTEAPARSDDQYVNSLVSEIVRLRERYQGRASNRDAVRATTSAASSGSPRRISSALRSQSAAALRSQSQNATAQNRTRLERMLADAPKRKEQVVATATLGSESYTPLLRTPVGKAVSPNLPPLGRSDAYLPGDRFKGYMWPAKGVLTSGYGWRWGRMHKGIDVAAPVGTPIVAAASGKVVAAGWNDGGYGNLVEIEHPDGSITRYAHNNRILVKRGQQVRQGQQIAEMGSTGFSTGPHSHFEVHLPGRGAVNPIALLTQSRG